MTAFNTLKMLLISEPIMRAPDWSLPFKLMCDASDFAVGAVLGQRINKIPHAIYYASRTLNDAQLNYSTTDKELLAVIFALEKFRLRRGGFGFETQLLVWVEFVLVEDEEEWTMVDVMSNENFMEDIIEEEFEDDVVELNPTEEPSGSQSKIHIEMKLDEPKEVTLTTEISTPGAISINIP
ncbi:uncharacterized protein LOC132178079 [Corylus avellana]|uniref:uncharacterized protein LOC132178079 n=1 Tax=Corylus avellana TaxID=13451 RepID=UPI00286BD6E5|nr:uncharacterized protein LOC132178079 [Corylus avellana]